MDLHEIVASVIGCAAFAGAGWAQGIAVDGALEDWSGIEPIATDPAGDAEGAFDVVSLSAETAGEVVYVLLTLAERDGGPVNLQSGAASDGTLKLRFEGPAGQALELDTRARQIEFTGPGGGATFEGGWTLMSYYALPTFAAYTYEMRFDVKLLGVEPGDTVTLTIGGSDTLEEPIELTLDSERPTPREDVQWRRHAEADVRFAVLNTEHEGLADSARSEEIGAMLRAVSPDVVLLQEEWETTAEEAAEALNAFAIGSEIGLGRRPWSVHAPGNGTLVATRMPLTPIPGGDGRYAAAGIEMPSGERLIAVSVHFKCCGSAGSEEDERRIEEAMAVAETLATVRHASDDGPLVAFRDPAVVVAGDYNLVGSRRPLDVLTRARPSGPGLEPAVLLGLNDRSAVTWYKEESGFSPGRLDLFSFSDETLDLERGYVLNTRYVHDAALTAMGIGRENSNDATDHLLMVADLSFEGGAASGGKNAESGERAGGSGSGSSGG